MRHLDLFSGIGGFALAAREIWVDRHEIVGFCDNDHFCQNVLAKNFPGVPIYGDIRELTAHRLAADAALRGGGGNAGAVPAQDGVQDRPQEPGEEVAGQSRGLHPVRIDLLTGGFPCQPFSNAGLKKGDKDDRHLWPEMLRVVRETRPTWIIGENVAGIINMALDQVCADLEGEGYEVQPFVIPACAVGAPHRRDRVWIVANRQGLVRERQQPSGKGRRESKEAFGVRGRDDWNRDWREVALATCHDRVDDGLPKELVVLPDGSRISQARWRREALKAYGNAIVPQVAVEIMKAIRDA